MPFRVAYWIPILTILFSSTIVHVRLLMVVISNRKMPHYSSFFFKMFISQSIIEVFFVYSYAFCDMVLRDSIFGDEFALRSGYIFPMFAYYGTYYFTVHSQVWGAVMISVNRYVTVCQPVSMMARFYDRIGYPVLYSINFFVPFLMMLRMLFQGSVYYYHTETGVLSIYTPMAIVKNNSLQGMIVSVIGSLICAVCYFLVIYRLASTNRAPNLRDYTREKMLTVVGFALFLALCASTLFYVLICINAAEDDLNNVIVIRSYYIYALMTLTFINPWMLVITNKNTRKRPAWNQNSLSPSFTFRLFFQRLEGGGQLIATTTNSLRKH